MINYLLINIILSSSALAINQWLQIPHRLRFYALMIAVTAWLIPFGLMGITISYESVMVLPAQVIELSQPIVAANQIIESSINHTFALALLLLIGLMLLIRDFTLGHNFIKILKHNSTPLHNDQQIRVTAQINGAFVSGYKQPIIWISQDLLHENHLQTVIRHEKQHIQNHDQYWLIIITCVQRLFWFNPLAYLVCRKCRQAIELSCDEACKQDLGAIKYQTHLAQIMLHNSQSKNNLLINSINHNKNFNLSRIEQLNQENKMTKTNTSQFIFIALTAIIMSSFTLVTVATGTTTPNIKDHQVFLTLKIQNGNKKPSELSILTNQGEQANVTYDNHDFGFTTQVMPNEPTQIYTDIVISEVENGIKTEISNPGIVTTNTHWGSFKFGQGEDYFDIQIKAQTSSNINPVAEAVDNFIELNDPIPAALVTPQMPTTSKTTNETMPKPTAPPMPSVTPTPEAGAHPAQPPQPIAAPKAGTPEPAIKPTNPPTPPEVDTNS